jgi:sarcosine oxidase subunit beta
LVFLDDADNAAPAVTAETWEVQSLRLARRLPELHVPSQKSGVVSAYDVTDDWIPIYDRTTLDGYYVAIGTSGHQFKAAPFVGELMSTLIAAVESGHDHEADPITVRGAWTGVNVPLSHFSRHRTVSMHGQMSDG